MPPKAATTRTSGTKKAPGEDTATGPIPEAPGAPAPSATEPAPAPTDILTAAATAVTVPFTLARQLLPDNPVPVALGAGALAVAGVIEWPVAVAVGLGYVALRRWNRPGPTAGSHSPGA